MITALFDHPDAKEAPPPQWAAGLVADIPAIRSVVEANAAELAALQEALAAIQSGLLQPGADPVDDQPPERSERRRDL